MTLFDTLSSRRGTNTALVNVLLVVAGSLLMTLAAKAQVPFYPVPMSMQTFVAIGLGLALGPVRGTAAILFYLAQGAAGLPVFAGTPQQGIGIAYMVGPTGGYLIGFAMAAMVAGFLAERGWDREPVGATAAAVIAGAVVYIPGLIWLGQMVGYNETLLQFGLYPFVLGDLVKAVLAGLVFPAAWSLVKAGEGH